MAVEQDFETVCVPWCLHLHLVLGHFPFCWIPCGTIRKSGHCVENSTLSV